MTDKCCKQTVTWYAIPTPVTSQFAMPTDLCHAFCQAKLELFSLWIWNQLLVKRIWPRLRYWTYHYLLVCRISSAIPWQLQTGWIPERREWLQRLVERPQKRSGDISAVCWLQTLLLRCCTLVQSVTAVLCSYYQFRLILPHPILYRLH